MLENNKKRGSRIKLIIIVLLKFHFFLTSFKDFNFPWLKAKFSDFSLPLKKIFPLTCSNHVMRGDHFSRCSDHRNLTGRILSFWIGGYLWEEVPYSLGMVTHRGSTLHSVFGPTDFLKQACSNFHYINPKKWSNAPSNEKILKATSLRDGSRKAYVLDRTLLLWTGMREPISFLPYGHKWSPPPNQGGRGRLQSDFARLSQ